MAVSSEASDNNHERNEEQVAGTSTIIDAFSNDDAVAFNGVQAMNTQREIQIRNAHLE